MGMDADGQDQEYGLLPGCICNPGIPTFTEGPSTVITFDVAEDNGLEDGEEAGA